MARKPKETKPLIEVMHDYDGALKATQQASMMLYQFCSSLVNMGPEIINPKMREMLQERCDEYRHAMYGDNQGN